MLLMWSWMPVSVDGNIRDRGMYVYTWKNALTCVDDVHSINPTHQIGQGLNYWILQIISQYLYLSKFLQAFFWYMGCTINQSSIPFGYFLHLLFRVNKVHFCVFCSLHNWSWQSRRQGITRYTNGWCTDTLATVLNKSPRYCLFQWWSFLLIISKACNFAVTTHYLSMSWGSWIHFTPTHPEIHF